MPNDQSLSFAGLRAFLASPIFLAAMMSMFTAQFIKAAIAVFRRRAGSLKDLIETLLWRTGGMPSSHSSLAVSITTAIAFEAGTDSPVFLLSFFFALVVIRDAMGVRRAAGLQAKAFNQFGKEVRERIGVAFHPVKEVHGHTFPQVLVGSMLGFFIALAFYRL